MDVRLDEVVLHALEREPARRYQQVSEVKTGVEAITSSLPAAPQVRPVSPAQALPAAAAATAPASSLPRLSRTALAGAACVVVFLGLIVNTFVFDLYEQPQGHWEGDATVDPATDPSKEVRFVAAPLTGWRVAVVASSVLGIASVLGMTVCGWVAVAQIRRSGGTLYGLSLAVFDGLFFPLLVADAIVCLVGTVTIRLVRFGSAIPLLTLSICVVLVCVGLDFFVIRKVWSICRQKSAN
jgi:hypothetical protein